MSQTTIDPPQEATSSDQGPKYPGIRITCNGNTLVAKYVETRITEGGVFYPITPSTEGGELYQQSFASGELDVWGNQKIAIETEGEHAAQGGATALAVTGKTGGELHLGPGPRLRDGAVLPRAGQVLDHGAAGRRPRAHQARAQRPLRPRRHLCRARHGLDDSLCQRRPAGRRPGASSCAKSASSRSIRA
jgi:hypothetical protein